MRLEDILMQLQDSMIEEIRTAVAGEQYRRRQLECEQIRRETLYAPDTKGD